MVKHYCCVGCKSKTNPKAPAFFIYPRTFNVHHVQDPILQDPELIEKHLPERKGCRKFIRAVAQLSEGKN
jgi:hypothetical protein